AMKNLVDAAIHALKNRDTTVIKQYLRRGSHANYIFISATTGNVRQSARSLFLRFKCPVPENFTYPDYWSFNYDDALGNILLQLAVIIFDYDLTKLLLEKGANVTSIDIQGRTALHIACQENSIETIKLLTECSPAYILNLPNNLGQTPLDEACRYCSPDVIQFLLQKGSSVVVHEDLRYDPFLNAAFNVAEYATPIASLLLDAGANINHTHIFGKTALIAAIEMSASEENSNIGQNCSYRDLCVLLIERGCDVNAAVSDGRTALHITIETNQEKLVRKLLICGSDIDRHDVVGFTPMFYACLYGRMRLVNLLIICGASLRAQNWETVIELLRSSSYSMSKILSCLITLFMHQRCALRWNTCAT
ncbi:death-associated protein kinase 1-like, partial [Stegodyphus dumicola]|uniref:death-associated protein kinase 1-like n=1 Tax=Stegodyphus dumicola TaxID=202533 RepID=UPI0015AC05FA